MKQYIIFLSTFCAFFASEPQSTRYVEFDDNKCSLVSTKDGSRFDASSCILHVGPSDKVPEGIYAYDSAQKNFLCLDSTERIAHSAMKAAEWKSLFFPKGTLVDTPAVYLLRMLRIMGQAGISFSESFTIINLGPPPKTSKTHA